LFDQNSSDGNELTSTERRVVFVVIMIQFINILEFMIVMPLGPDFSRDLAIKTSQLGVISGSYTFASAIVGLLSASYLERYDRKNAVIFAMSGLVFSTMLAGWSQNIEMLIGARVLAGIFGGPSTSLALAIISDVVPPARRGRALGAVMSSFAIASIAGVPLGLEAARIGGWRLPFFFIAMLGLFIIFAVFFLLPNFRAHMQIGAKEESSLFSMLRRPAVLFSLATSGLLMSSGFMLIPNIAPYVQQNLGYPRDSMGFLYFVGGLASFASMVLFGRLTDRLGALVVGILGCSAFFLSAFLGFVHPWEHIPVPAFFSLFMIASALRGVSFNTLSSRVPGSHERARFMSVQSSVQHISSALGASISSLILAINADRLSFSPVIIQSSDKLYGIEILAWIAIFLNLLMVAGLYLMQRSLAASSTGHYA
jgi:predicted MFS family arabinose efflux permease